MPDLIKMTLPGDPDIAGQVTEIYRWIFGEEEVLETRDQFAGLETAFQTDTLYVAMDCGRVKACCQITKMCRHSLGGLGGVATLPEARGLHIAEKLLRFAIADFEVQGGDVLFLGTGNPDAANLYRKLGFGFLPGTHGMVRISGMQRVTDIMKRELPGGTAKIRHGDASARLPLIPLAYDERLPLVADAAAGLYGTRTFVMHSCMGLYPRYQAVRAAGGDWFGLFQGVHLVGAGSWKPTDNGKALADAFWIPEHIGEAEKLLRTIHDSAARAGYSAEFPVSTIDEDKKSVLSRMNARNLKTGNLTPCQGVAIPVTFYAL